MCWSMEASAGLATIGAAGVVYAVYKKKPKELWLVLGYFTLMEFLQAYTYTVINQCQNPANQMATVLGYLHITFQPFFINMISLYFIPQNTVKKIAPFVYAFCFVGAIFMIIRLYPFAWAPKCVPGIHPLCGNILCSVSGQWHIAWDLPINTVAHSFAYYGPAFILPLFYGSWRLTTYHIIMGPLLAYLLTNNYNEMAAVWCLLSIGFLSLVVATRLQKLLFVKKWYFWNYPT